MIYFANEFYQLALGIVYGPMYMDNGTLPYQRLQAE